MLEVAPSCTPRTGPQHHGTAPGQSSPFLAARRRVGAAGRCQRRKSTPPANIGEARISPPCCLKSLSCAAKSQTKNLPEGEGKRARRDAGEAVLDQPRGREQAWALCKVRALARFGSSEIWSCVTLLTCPLRGP